MTVGELRERLKDLPDHYTVKMFQTGYAEGPELEEDIVEVELYSQNKLVWLHVEFCMTDNPYFQL